MRRQAANLNVGERVPSVAGAFWVRGAGGDDVLESVEGDDQQQEQKDEQAEEDGDVDVDVLQAIRGGGGVHGGGYGGGDGLE